MLDRTGAVVTVNRTAQALLGGGPFAAVTSESAKRYRVRDEVTGRALGSIEDALARAFAGEAFRDLRLRMFLPALGRDASMRVDAEPLRASEGSVRGVIAAVTELVERSEH